MRIDPDGYKISALILLGAFILWIAFGFLRWQVLSWAAWAGVVMTVYSLFFFRDPARTVPEAELAAVSAADGVVVDVSTVAAEGFEGGEAVRIAVFMNIFNVHVNRIPVTGTVIRTNHRPGKKLSAYNTRAEYENEHGDIDIETREGPVRVRQIAGLIARRVVTRVSAGDKLNKGDRIGLIRFGSRVDVFLPGSYKPAVKQGDHVRAGETVIASIAKSNETLNV